MGHLKFNGRLKTGWHAYRHLFTKFCQAGARAPSPNDRALPENTRKPPNVKFHGNYAACIALHNKSRWAGSPVNKAKSLLFQTRMVGGPAESRPVICVETGQIFNSMGEAARHVKRYRRSIKTAIEKPCTCAGFHWAYHVPDTEAAGDAGLLAEA
eukprot:g30015.t1